MVWITTILEGLTALTASLSQETTNGMFTSSAFFFFAAELIYRKQELLGLERSMLLSIPNFSLITSVASSL